ncbi:Putative RNA-dependent RNA polymerase, eukaryotic-type [Septoria linicola]|uniref:RNA-dependent RNA polymerase n=1 Tax=Septoria linicola TaxID=215465 RepID=A0A9Q9APN0_9PEZI|nr:putative RNA-dependent RNA polymerase, eukaryotic-type [Septoria linicola]USW50828.1 Putative RNA-dependent RNA polymerase, eukaryotic-type [Septoria linicola]
MAFTDLLPSDESSTSTSTSTPTSFRATPPHLRRGAAPRPATQPSAPRPEPPLPRSLTAPTPPPRAPPVTMHNHHKSPAYNPLELRVSFTGAPRYWTTYDIYSFFERFGIVSRVEVRKRNPQDIHGVVFFQPPPKDRSWVGRTLPVHDRDGFQKAVFTRNDTKPIFWYRSPLSNRDLPERMNVAMAALDFGVMQQEDKMLILHTAQPSAEIKIELTMNLQHKDLHISFPVKVPIHPSSGRTGLIERHFKLRIMPAQIGQAYMLRDEDGSTSVVFTIDTPPLVFRKTHDTKSTHDSQATLWDERKTWLRQTDIDLYPWARNSAIELKKENTVIEVGRWLTYKMKFTPDVLQTPEFRNLCQALADHNVNMTTNRNITSSLQYRPDALWNWLGPPRSGNRNAAKSFLSGLEEMADDSVPLPFEVRYQLEVCISLGALHECNLTRDFLRQLNSLEPRRVVKMLERVADRKVRYYDPIEMLPLHNKVSVVEKKRPGYCTKIPSVTITPTTMYMATPVLETSNRVIRYYQQYEDRFLRVRFTDERYKGRIMASEDNSMNEVFSRVKRAMTHGIKIGDRHYEFLAFGNSQFRDHGAYFFSPATGVTAADIRDWMGDFTSIRVIAKYVSRLGQCFSTTRSIPHSINVETIPDVERNGFGFTDGVGKISPFLARMIAHHYGLANSEHDYPSVFQFRLAGCKGVLAVDPSLKGMNIQIRPSQQKFPAKANGLEICRISQFSTASLNVQLILVLSALGVPDGVFLGKLRHMLSDMQEALESEKKALDLLQKNIDFNQTTIALACMIFDGFMATDEPFVISCLRLWRSWNLKYLKEKARIFIDQGAFLLGCTDESGTLAGYYKSKEDETGTLKAQEPTGSGNDAHDESKLAEIFLQIPDPHQQGTYKVVEGVVALARNPSLHPGDIRVVKAVDNIALRHLKNCVVLPQTGDRDVANTCSGGDLDGDDFIVIWDPELIPPQWNHDPMDYTSPDPVMAEGPVTVDNMTSFFVQHIKNDILSRIACAHRYWADWLPDGVKEKQCLELAQLHSKAVDYPKTGVPAVMPASLRVQQWPHWCEPKSKAKSKVYTSNKVLGKLYNEVKKEPFNAAWDMPFDERILTACEPSERMLRDAKEVKALYDEAIRRIMNQHGIKTEFEVFTTFILDHHQEIGDYKFAETMGEITNNLKQEHKELCYEKAGTTNHDRDWDKIKPFIVAMYQVTAAEIEEALLENKTMRTVGGRDMPLRALTFESMPLMTFPWIFAHELGRIATKGQSSGLTAMPRPVLPAKSKLGAKNNASLLPDDWRPAPLGEVDVSRGVVREGELLDLFAGDTEGGGSKEKKAVVVVPDLLEFEAETSSADNTASSSIEEGSRNSGPSSCLESGHQERPNSFSKDLRSSTPPSDFPAAPADLDERELTGDEVELEVVMQTAFEIQPSGLDKLMALVGVSEDSETEN